MVEFTMTVNHLLESSTKEDERKEEDKDSIENFPVNRVQAEFRLEGQKFRHTPGQFRFREKWLTEIIEQKKSNARDAYCLNYLS